jgi:hypothetical protein
VAESLELDPLSCDRVSLNGRRTPVSRELDQPPDNNLEACSEGESERPPLVQEGCHGNAPAVADLADHVVDGNLDPGEEDLVELGLARDLAQRANLDTGRAHVDDQTREARVALGGGIAAGDEQAPVGDVRVGRPHLLAVDDEAGSLEPRARPYRREVGTGLRLGEALAPDLFRGENVREAALLLGVGAMGDDRRSGHPDPDHTEMLRRFGPRELLVEDRLIAVRFAATAVLDGPGQPAVARGVETATPVAEVCRVGPVLGQPCTKVAAKLRLVGRIPEIHGPILRSDA